MNPTVKAARIAGAIYLSMVVLGPFSLMYVPNTIIVTGNAAATGANVLAHETLFRLGIIADLFGPVIFVCLAAALCRLLGQVDRNWARLMFGFVLVSAAVGFANVLNSIAALIFFHGGEFLTVMEETQRQALGMFFLRLHGQGNIVNEIFWGLWLFPFGLLVFRSGFIPRFLGVWLMVNCFGWIFLSLTALFFRPYYDGAFRLAQPLLFGELAVMLWLLIKGARVGPATATPSLAFGSFVI